MEELLKQLKEARAALGQKDAELDARIKAIEDGVKARETDVATARTELQKLREEVTAAEKEHKDMLQAARTEALHTQGFQDKNHALIVTGAAVRDLWNRERAQDERVKAPEFETKLLERHKAQRASMLESGAITGSYTVPTIFDVNMIDTLEKPSEVSQLADVTLNLPGNVIIPTITGRPTFNHKRAAKSGAISKSAPAFGQASMTPQEGTMCFDADNQLMVMSALDLGALFVQLLQQALSGALSYDMLLGDGTDNSNGITGMLNVTDGEDIYALETGKTVADLAYQDMYEIEAMPFARCSAAGRWLSSRSVFGKIAGIDCQGKAPLLRFEAGQRYILEHPWFEATDMYTVKNATGAAKPFLAFGDPKSYKIGLVGGPRVSVSGHARHEYNQTQWLLVVYYDIVRKHKRGMCVVKTGKAA